MAGVIKAANKVFKYNKELADRAIVQVSSSQMHKALDPATNSIVIIMKHIAGNLCSRWTDFLTTDGEKPWRNRDDEFVDDFESREQLTEYWESGWKCVFETLDQLTDEDLAKEITIRGESLSVPLAIQRSLSHTGYHVGQIVMIARIHCGQNWETLTIARGDSRSHNESNWGKQQYDNETRN